jgi:hypothetical protein
MTDFTSAAACLPSAIARRNYKWFVSDTGMGLSAKAVRDVTKSSSVSFFLVDAVSPAQSVSARNGR